MRYGLCDSDAPRLGGLGASLLALLYVWLKASRMSYHLGVQAKQSWPSAFVDVAIVGSVVALCFVPNVSPMAWSVLGQIALVRFGVAVTKQALGNGNGNGGGNGYDPPSDKREDRKSRDRDRDTDIRRSVLSHAVPAIVVALAMLLNACR